MAEQIIFVLETNPRERTDLIYINEVIDQFFGGRRNNDVNYNTVFMNGKGNYKKTNVLKKINDFAKAYKPLGKSHVVYCFDTDKFDSDNEAKTFLDTVEEYCRTNGYEFVWFCHDVEEVFWGHTVNKNEKSEFAKKFTRNNEIKGVDYTKLCCTKKSKATSNLAKILAKLLPST